MTSQNRESSGRGSFFLSFSLEYHHEWFAHTVSLSSWLSNQASSWRVGHGGGETWFYFRSLGLSQLFKIQIENAKSALPLSLWDLATGPWYRGYKPSDIRTLVLSIDIPFIQIWSPFRGTWDRNANCFLQKRRSFWEGCWGIASRTFEG